MARHELTKAHYGAHLHPVQRNGPVFYRIPPIASSSAASVTVSLAVLHRCIHLNFHRGGGGRGEDERERVLVAGN